jgi:Peptidase family S41
MRRKVYWLLSLVMFSGLANGQAFEHEKWHADFAELRRALAAGYANLDWAVAARKIDLPALVKNTKNKIDAAKNDSDGARAFEEFLATFNDGHLELVPRKTVRAQATNPAALKTCTDMGFRSTQHVGIKFESVGRYEALADSSTNGFSAGILRLPNGRKLGVLHLPELSETIFPALCADVFNAPASCDDACEQRLLTEVAKRATDLLSQQVNALLAKKVSGIFIDLTGNGGGSNWASAVAQVFSASALVAPRLAFIKHPHWVKQFDERVADFDADLKRNDLSKAQRKLINDARYSALSAREIAAQSCERDAIWEGKSVCKLDVPGFLYSTGYLKSPPDIAIMNFGPATAIYQPIAHKQTTGIYRGHLAVLMDGNTASAAEMVAAILKDNGRATLIGAPTYGAGCGYTNSGIPVVLKHSGLGIKMPDCIRLRADGTNEVAGIEPDITVPWRRRDTDYQRAIRAEKVLSRWISFINR